MSTKSDAGFDDRSFLTRAAHMPVRDVLRLRVSGRLDVRHLLAQSELPASLQSLVQRIVRGTRLWRIEKVDVAKELIAHFSDGLGTGASPEQLALDFGDPDQTAALIRRAKKRNRPAWWKTARLGAYGVACLFLLYTGLAVYFAVGRPNVATDVLALVNERAAAAEPDERAWPHYRSALLSLEEVPASFKLNASSQDEGWEELRAYLERNAEALAIARQATKLPKLGYVAGYTIKAEDALLWPGFDPNAEPNAELGAIGLLLPHLASLRQLALLLDADARRAAMDGDGATLVANITALVRIASHVREHPILISDLVGYSILALAMRTASTHLASNPELFSDEDLIALAHHIGWASSQGQLRTQLDGERYVFMDVVQRVYTDDGRGDGRFTPQGIRLLDMLGSPSPVEPNFAVWALAPLTNIAVANRRDMMAKYDEFYSHLLAEASTPLWQRDNLESFDARLERELSQSILMRVRYLPIGLLMPAISKATINGELVGQRCHGALIAIALELYHRRHGAWPESLDQLTPRFLPNIPADRHDGKPIRYLLRDGQPVVYSVGSNREDDGGIPAIGRDGYPDPEAAMQWFPLRRVRELREQGTYSHHHIPLVPEGDWILWSRE